jgi:hypothetical protein
MIKRMATSALVLALGCTGVQVDNKDNFAQIADMRDNLAKGVHPATKQMEARWQYSETLQRVVRLYQTGRMGKSDSFHPVIELCRMSNENLREAEITCAETNVCDNLYSIRGNNRVTQSTCREIIRHYL